MKTIVDLRAQVQEGTDQGADYHAKPDGHWINSTVIATPMSKYPAYQATRRSFGIDVLGTVLVEVEADDGMIGFAMTTGGIPAAYLTEKQFRRFVVGQPACMSCANSGGAGAKKPPPAGLPNCGMPIRKESSR